MATTTDVATKEAAEISLPITQYSGEDLQEIISENMGGEDFTPFDLDRITMPAGGGTTWEVPTLDGESGAVKDLRGVIVYAKTTRSYWSSDEVDSTPPDCASVDGIIGSGDPGGLCSNCPNSQFGSGKNGSKACKETKAVFLLMEGNMLPVVVQVPPTSLKLFKKYMSRLTNGAEPYYTVITSMTLTKTKSNSGYPHSVIQFNKAGSLSPELKEAVKQYRKGFASVFGNTNGQKTEDAPSFG